MKTWKLRGAGLIASATMLAGCATVAEDIVEQVAETYDAELTGAQQVGSGDPDGYATAEVSVADNLDEVCYEVKSLRGIGPVTAAHIHRGAMGVNGPPVVPLTMAEDGGIKGCTSVAEEIQDAIENNPAGFYVNIHTQEYPNGAIRGQLRP